MRALLMLLLLMPLISALIVENTGIAGQNPVIYGNKLAYEREGNIYVYDIAKKEEWNVSSGTNPSLFGFELVFETNGTIMLANTETHNIISIETGSSPNMFSNIIVFSTNEKALGIDFSNDGDAEDEIIRLHDVEKNETINLKVVGSHPAINNKFVLFLTEEKQIGADLNNNKDLKDKILRVFDRKAKKTASTGISATSTSFFGKTNTAVIVSEGRLLVFDAASQKATDTGIIGNSPAIFDKTVLFERNGELFGFSLETMHYAKLNIMGANPFVFEDTAVFVSPESEIGDVNNDNKLDFVIRYAREEDLDGDNLPDFTDNCPAIANPEQEDADKNGIGKACGTEQEMIVEDETRALNNNSDQINSSGNNKKSGIKWKIVILLIPLLYCIGYFAYKHYKKKQKSFGF